MRLASLFSAAAAAFLGFVGPVTNAAPQTLGELGPSIAALDPAVMKAIDNDMYTLSPEFKIKLPHNMVFVTNKDYLDRLSSIDILTIQGDRARKIKFAYWGQEKKPMSLYFKKYAPDTRAQVESTMIEVRYSTVRGFPEYYKIYDSDDDYIEATVKYGKLSHTGDMTLNRKDGSPAGTLKGVKACKWDKLASLLEFTSKPSSAQ
ncbi:hypothetical protein THASP1DRAFT_26045 [Thamnocephalis sphaerospora]|uniref:Uncharacterized protein n=1 Tax=Thamnocephalis sphaerospora TaxID=78915 RepID=A0A4P9XHT6_9FUNG|nr:hypothetical protein THASP1DRAFT_26207 [Thamnocephalis sphaerospora]RKP05466.1 hypothetical protein THASP1DRAFT_26045 [Thamnocephalis sphaerospora]|eukprot:RKP05265.1 hypothetical protein THASP1DRAFT_26207 [Thamnocephalis sphaerospora]